VEVLRGSKQFYGVGSVLAQVAGRTAATVVRLDGDPAARTPPHPQRDLRAIPAGQAADY